MEKEKGVTLVEAKCQPKSRVKADQDWRNPLAFASLLPYVLRNSDGSSVHPMCIFNFDVTGLDVTENKKVRVYKHGAFLQVMILENT